MKHSEINFVDERLGTFVFHKSGYRDYFKNKYQYNGSTIILHLEEPQFLADLHRIIEYLPDYIAAAKTFILQELRPNFETWDVYTNDAEFIERLQLNTIMQQQPGAYIFWFDSGDLLLERCICVYGDIENGCTDAVIEGKR